MRPRIQVSHDQIDSVVCELQINPDKRKQFLASPNVVLQAQGICPQGPVAFHARNQGTSEVCSAAAACNAAANVNFLINVNAYIYVNAAAVSNAAALALAWLGTWVWTDTDGPRYEDL
jgi:hypothetical protein